MYLTTFCTNVIFLFKEFSLYQQDLLFLNITNSQSVTAHISKLTCFLSMPSLRTVTQFVFFPTHKKFLIITQLQTNQLNNSLQTHKQNDVKSYFIFKVSVNHSFYQPQLNIFIQGVLSYLKSLHRFIFLHRLFRQSIVTGTIFATIFLTFLQKRFFKFKKGK